MTFTIEWGWWLAPLAVTVATFAIVMRMNRGWRYGGDYSFGGIFAAFNCAAFWIVPSLAAWLAWALLK